MPISVVNSPREKGSMWFSSNALDHGNLLTDQLLGLVFCGNRQVQERHSTSYITSRMGTTHPIFWTATGYPQRTKLEQIWTPPHSFQLRYRDHHAPKQICPSPKHMETILSHTGHVLTLSHFPVSTPPFVHLLISYNSQHALQQEAEGDICWVLISALLTYPVTPGPPLLSQVHRN